jgi:hypothetical protein
MAQAGDDTDAVFGSYTPVCDSLWTEASAIAYAAVSSASEGRGPFVASMAIRRQVFIRLGGFPDYRAAEDLVFIERALCSGLRVAFAPDAIVHWQLAPTPAATYRRFALYSHHNLAADRGHAWHAGLARLYAVLALLVFGASLLSATAAAAIIPAFFLARAFRAAYRHRRDLPTRTLAPHRVVFTALVLLIVDVATLVGAARWLRKPQPGQRTNEPTGE